MSDNETNKRKILDSEDQTSKNQKIEIESSTQVSLFLNKEKKLISFFF